MNEMLFSNHASSRMVYDTDAISGTVTVEPGFGVLFPDPQPTSDPTKPQFFMVTLEDRRTGQVEICKCTARSNDVLTIVRGQEGTLAQAFTIGATVSHRLTAETLTTFQVDIDSKTDEAPDDGRIYGRNGLYQIWEPVAAPPFSVKADTSLWLFDGFADTFELVDENGNLLTPASAADCQVSLDGVIQEPWEDYSTYEKFIHFTTPPERDVEAWALVGSSRTSIRSNAFITLQDNPPATPWQHADLWARTNGTLFIYDVDAQAWIQLSGYAA
jgi:hypothetical protein